MANSAKSSPSFPGGASLLFPPSISTSWMPLPDDDDDDGGNATVDVEWASTTATPPWLAEPPYPVWAATLIIVACSLVVVGTVVGNTLVCTAVSIVRKLRTPSNWLIVSLAVADLLVALLVMPLAVVYEIKGYWPLNRAVCDAWTSLDVLLCTASILNLCMISVDRYFVITRPFQYAVKRTPARMVAMILSVWILSALISIPPLFGWRQDLPQGQCELSQAIGYQFYATIGAFYLPLVVMIIIYVRIYAVSKRIAVAEARSKPARTSSLRHGHGSNASDSVFFHQRSESLMPNVNSKTSLDGATSGGNHNRLDVNSYRPSVSNASARNNSVDCNNYYQQSTGGGAGGGHSSGLRKNLSFLHRTGFNRLPSASKDTKATKTLGVIMGAFTVCWLPFFILALVKPFCRHCIPESLNSIFLWLGFANSFLNPIIYARFNRDFRTPFKEILLCRCGGIDRRLRSESYAEQYGSGQHHSPSVHVDEFLPGAGGGGPRASSSFAFASHGRPSTVEVPLTPTAISTAAAASSSGRHRTSSGTTNGVH
jgi:5-hydroxytryptamine receptor 7